MEELYKAILPFEKTISYQIVHNHHKSYVWATYKQLLDFNTYVKADLEGIEKICIDYSLKGESHV